MEEEFEAGAIGDKLAFQSLLLKNTSLLGKRIGRSRDNPLHLVCRFKQKELASPILGLQPDMPRAKNEKEETPLHEASRVGGLEIVKEMLDACPSVAYMLNRDKESALFIACSCGHLEVAWELCSRIDFLAWDGIGASCLEIAASKGYIGDFLGFRSPNDLHILQFKHTLIIGVFMGGDEECLYPAKSRPEVADLCCPA